MLQGTQSVVAIHQPNFLPWMGFFDKAHKADVLILLDSVQFAKRSWINRVRILTASGPSWLTVPVRVKGRYQQRIDEVEIDDSSPWRRKHLQTLRRSLQRLPGFELIEAELFPALSEPHTLLVDLNMALLEVLFGWLGLERNVLRSSRLPCDGESTHLLASLTRAAGGNAYLSGDGADGYQEEEVFTARGIHFRSQQFVPPCYPQGREEFVPGLSIVDAVARCGIEKARRLLVHGEENVTRDTGRSAGGEPGR